MGCGKFCAAYCGAMCFVGIFWNIVMGILEVFRSQYLLIQEDSRQRTYVGCFIAAGVCLVCCAVCCVIAQCGCGRIRKEDQAMHLSSRSAQMLRFRTLNEKYHNFEDEEEKEEEEEEEEKEEQNEQEDEEEVKDANSQSNKERYRPQQFYINENEIKIRSITDNTYPARNIAGKRHVKQHHQSQKQRLPRFADQRPRDPYNRSISSGTHKRA